MRVYACQSPLRKKKQISQKTKTQACTNIRFLVIISNFHSFFFRDELAAALASIETNNPTSSSSGASSNSATGGTTKRQPRSLQAEMECEESGASSLGPHDQQHELRQEVGRACRRLRELSSHLRRGEDDSGLQSDCDESMLVLNNANESEVTFFATLFAIDT